MGVNKMLEKALAGTTGDLGKVLGRILELLEEQNDILSDIKAGLMKSPQNEDLSRSDET